MAMTDVTAEQQTAGPRGSRRWWPIVVIPLLLIASFALFTVAQGDRESLAVVGADEGVADRVDVMIVVREVDTVRGEVKCRVFVEPHGSLVAAEGGAAREFVVDVSDETGKGSIKVAAGGWHQGTDIAVSTDEGEDVLYPLDRYTASLWAAARTTGEGGADVPVRLAVFTANSTFRFDHEQLAEAEELGGAGLRITARRSAVTIGLVGAMVVIMWALALAVGAVALAMRAGRRRFEFPTLTWMAAMLFAFVGFRNAAPGSPPFGSLFDFLAFFWVELIVAGSLLMCVRLYLRDGQGSA